MEETFDQYRERVKARIEKLMPLFAKAAIGDFSQTAELENEDDEFARLYEGVNILVEAARSRVGQLEKTNKDMESQMRTTVTALETARHLEERLTDQAARLHAVVSSMGEGLLVISGHSIITLVNEAAEHILNIARDDLVGKDFHSIIKVSKERHVIPENEKPIGRTLRDGITSVAEVKDGLSWELPSGHSFPVAFVATPVQLQGEVHAIVVFRDVTEQKTIDHAKSEFVSLASHQLRGPLTTIKWYVSSLLAGESGALNDPQARDIGILQSVSDRLIQLVDALLDISRIEMGTLAVTPRPLDLVELCKGSLQTTAAEIHKKQLNVREHYDEHLPLVNLDPQLTELIIQNLLTNAVKYTSAGGSISLAVTQQKDSFVITVTDTGMGIPADQQARLFTKFFRADNASHSETSGTGLGLYMTKEVVDRLGGKITFTSELNKGSSFSVSLPLTGMREQQGRTRLSSIDHGEIVLKKSKS